MNSRNRSQELYEKSLKYIPGGVNSPVRAFKSVGGTPVFMQSAKGSILTDVDGNEYIDYISSWGPMILGHAHPRVVEAVSAQLKDSSSFGAPTEKEFLLAELIKKMVPGLEKIRMVNSGTEACMSAIRLARGYTGKSKIIKFEGCYHGHADSFLIKAGSGASTFGEPDSPGVTPGTAGDTLNASFNNLEEVAGLIDKNKNQIAAIILEPVVGNMGCVLPKEGFLQGIRDLCTKNNIVLIFDEVMTGFRLAPGGAQELFGIQADLVTFGKIIGGGMPVGAFGGKAEIMDKLSPAGPVYQAGTLSGNPVAMTAGLATLSELVDHPEIYSKLSKKTDYLAEGLSKAMKENSIDFRINKIGSMITLFFTDVDVDNFETSATANNESFKKFFHGMLDEGVYLPPSSFESWFLSNTLSYEMLDKTIAAAEKTVKGF